LTVTGTRTFLQSGMGEVVYEQAVSVLLSGRMTVAAGDRVVRMGSLAVQTSGVVDLNDNDLVLNSGNFSTLQALVLNGYAPAPDSTKTGIISTTSQHSGGTAILALFDNALAGLGDWPAGSRQTISTTAIVGKYTYLGDADMDGQVTSQDYTAIDANLGTHGINRGIAWFYGDTNFDGNTTVEDYTGIDSALGFGQGNPLTVQGLPAVPEPASVGMIALGAAGLLMRRRRRQDPRVGCSVASAN
jgi:hypothetical protein